MYVKAIKEIKNSKAIKKKIFNEKLFINVE